MKTALRILAFVLGLSAALWLHASPVAYITHQNGVSVVDLGFRAVIAELPGNGAMGVTVRPELNRAYVADRDKVSVIDTRAQAVIATAGYPTIGGLITSRPGRAEAYVLTDHCSNAPGAACTTEISSVIRVFNTDTNALGDTFADLGSSLQSRIEFSTDGLLMFLTRVAPSSVAIINATTRQQLASIALASPPAGMALDPANNLLYVAETGGSIAVVDVANRSLLARIPTGGNPTELVLAGSRLFASSANTNTVLVVDRITRAFLGSVAVGSRPIGIDATPNSDQVVVANNGSNTISVIDVTSLNIVATIAVGPAPQAIGRFIIGSSAPQLPDVLTGLWWNPAESGWGVHVAHRGNKIFAAWFTYNADGQPKWYVSSDCVMNSQLPTAPGGGEATCTGSIYETTGPRFFSDAFNPGAVTVNKLGLFQMGFSDANNGAMSVVIGSSVKSMTLKRQVFASGNMPAANYTDLWWNPAESGWGIGITQQASTMFLAWFAYDDTGAPRWYVASNCAVNAAGDGCTGDVYRTSGPVDPLRNPFDPSKVQVTKVGTITASFADANTGTLVYTVDGKAGTKQITRQVF